MKTLVIGDIHGLSIWKKLIEEYEWDKVIFLGDYVDSFTVPDVDILNNLQEIIQFKKDNMSKAILLLGNHDAQYIWKGNNCSGRRTSMVISLGILFKDNLDLFTIAYKEGKYIFSHAGILNSWLDDNKNILDEYGILLDEIEILNNLMLTHNKDILFQCGLERGGFDKSSGPLWADKEESINDGDLEGIIQVVGHTAVDSIVDEGHIIFCDCLEHGDGVPLILNT